MSANDSATALQRAGPVVALDFRSRLDRPVEQDEIRRRGEAGQTVRHSERERSGGPQIRVRAVQQRDHVRLDLIFRHDWSRRSVRIGSHRDRRAQVPPGHGDVQKVVRLYGPGESAHCGAVGVGQFRVVQGVQEQVGVADVPVHLGPHLCANPQGGGPGVADAAGQRRPGGRHGIDLAAEGSCPLHHVGHADAGAEEEALCGGRDKGCARTLLQFFHAGIVVVGHGEIARRGRGHDRAHGHDGTAHSPDHRSFSSVHVLRNPGPPRTRSSGLGGRVPRPGRGRPPRSRSCSPRGPVRRSRSRSGDCGRSD